eukprot:1159014-Pelagomonas_calceolata.AAC.2
MPATGSPYFFGGRGVSRENKQPGQKEGSRSVKLDNLMLPGSACYTQSRIHERRVRQCMAEETGGAPG